MLVSALELKIISSYSKTTNSRNCTCDVCPQSSLERLLRSTVSSIVNFNCRRANKLRMTMMNRIYLNETKQRLARKNIKKEKRHS